MEAILGVPSIAAITIICYIIGEGIKLSKIKNRAIPFLCGVSGAVIGLVWFFTSFIGFPAEEPFTAAAVGIVSGLAATGVNQIFKKPAGK